nr:photosystem I assembly protein Ycf37 [Chroomonas debatzensis]
MENVLPLIYLLILASLLFSLAFFVVTEIVKKQTLESNLYDLQKKVRKKEATYEDYYLLGTLYLSKKLFDQAIIQFRYALQAWNSTDTIGLANLYNTIGFTYFESEQYDLSIYYYKEAIKNLNDYVTAWNNLGYAYEKKKMIPEAVKSYETVLGYENNNQIASDRLQILMRKIQIRDDRI